MDAVIGVVVFIVCLLLVVVTRRRYLKRQRAKALLQCRLWEDRVAASSRELEEVTVNEAWLLKLGDGSVPRELLEIRRDWEQTLEDARRRIQEETDRITRGASRQPRLGVPLGRLDDFRNQYVATKEELACLPQTAKVSVTEAQDALAVMSARAEALPQAPAVVKERLAAAAALCERGRAALDAEEVSRARNLAVEALGRLREAEASIDEQYALEKAVRTAKNRVETQLASTARFEARLATHRDPAAVLGSEQAEYAALLAVLQRGQVSTENVGAVGEILASAAELLKRMNSALDDLDEEDRRFGVGVSPELCSLWRKAAVLVSSVVDKNSYCPLCGDSAEDCYEDECCEVVLKPSHVETHFTQPLAHALRLLASQDSAESARPILDDLVAAAEAELRRLPEDGDVGEEDDDEDDDD